MGWRYRSVPAEWTKSQSGVWPPTGDIKVSKARRDWTNGLTSVREALENADNDSMKVMDQFKMDLYEDEVFVFTPKGDLFKLAKGATVLDFAFHIHSKLDANASVPK